MTDFNHQDTIKTNHETLLKHPVYPVAEVPAFDARTRWFRARHPQRNIAASISQRLSSRHVKVLTHCLWEPGSSLEDLGNPLSEPLFPGAIDETSSRAMPEGRGEFWLQLVAYSPGLARSPTPPHYVWPQAHEFYSLHWSHQADQLELLETRNGRDAWTLSCYIPPLTGQIPEPEPARSTPAEFQTNQNATPDPASVWQEAHDKLHCYPAYFYAAQQARLQPGAQVLELGSNHWPVMPLGVFEANPSAEFHTIDRHQDGLELMGSVMEELRPGWLRRVHRHLADFTEVLPIADSSIDVAVSVAAFSLTRSTPDQAWSVLLELHRVLRPGGRFFWEGAEFESQPAWLTGSVLQRFKIAEQWNGGRRRELCLQKLS